MTPPVVLALVGSACLVLVVTIALVDFILWNRHQDREVRRWNVQRHARVVHVSGDHETCQDPTHAHEPGTAGLRFRMSSWATFRMLAMVGLVLVAVVVFIIAALSAVASMVIEQSMV